MHKLKHSIFSLNMLCSQLKLLPHRRNEKKNDVIASQSSAWQFQLSKYIIMIWPGWKIQWSVLKMDKHIWYSTIHMWPFQGIPNYIPDTKTVQEIYIYLSQLEITCELLDNSSISSSTYMFMHKHWETDL